MYNITRSDTIRFMTKKTGLRVTNPFLKTVAERPA